MLTGKLVVDLDRRYAVKDAARVLGISRRTLDNYAKANKISPILHGPTGQIFYLGSEIKRFYDQII